MVELLLILLYFLTCEQFFSIVNCVALSLFLVLSFLFFLMNLLLSVPAKEQRKQSGKFKGAVSRFSHVQALLLAVVNFTVSYLTR